MNANQLTNQGEQMIQVYFKDKTSDLMWIKMITRAFLARMYHEQRVIGLIKRIPVIEV